MSALADDSMPLASALAGLQFFALFLNQVVIAVVFTLVRWWRCPAWASLVTLNAGPPGSLGDIRSGPR